MLSDLSADAPAPVGPATPPPHRPPALLIDRSPLIVPDELLHFPANVRRGDLRRPGGVISTHSLGCRQRRRRQKPAWTAQSADRTARTAPGRPRRCGRIPASRPLAPPRPPLPWVGGYCPHTSLGWALEEGLLSVRVPVYPGGGAGRFRRAEAPAGQVCCGPNRC